MISWPERILAASIPLITLAVGYISYFLGFFAPLLCYLALRKTSKQFASWHAVRCYDFCITIIAYAVAIGTLQFSLGIVARDGDNPVFLILSSVISFLTTTGSVIYISIGLLLLIVFPLLGKDLKLPFTPKVFAAWVKYFERDNSITKVVTEEQP
ncbi:hypothetical protein ACMXYV_00425 [Neptuniibacter sp. SY11_33]|uniref:hypothetical protein n=1 Tax=Neptuniibacter sp. SY11_33 TaxID=3398215 RepID=UPI0039F44AA7